MGRARKGAGKAGEKAGEKAGGERRVKIGGIPVTVVSEAAAEEAEMVVCLLEGMFTVFDDNLTGPCACCRRTVIFRPTAPKKPQKLCMDCAMPMMAPAAGRA